MLKKSLLITVSALALSLPFAAPAEVNFISQAQAQEHPASFADLIEKLSPAVVNISSSQKVKTPQGFSGFSFPNDPEFEPFRDFFERFGNPYGMMQPQEREVYSLGSGFIIDPKGYVITNNHVVDGAEEITVILSDNEKYKAEIIGRDPKTDLALLKVEAKKDLPFVTMGDSDAARVGDWVIAIGNPFGLGGSVTQGIISARQRNINAGPFDDFLQTDAPINRGNSGGPLFNIKGEVIGINSAIFSPGLGGGSVGIGFAIPTSLAKPVIEQLKEFGRTHRGWLGVKIQGVSEEIADSMGMKKPIGALVLEVSKDSPADKAGIRAGDIITEFDGQEINEMRFLPRIVAETEIGKKTSVKFWRNNAEKTASITIGELDEKIEQADSSESKKGKNSTGNGEGESVAGMNLSEITPQIRSRLRLDGKVTGLIVLDVTYGSEAAHKGIKRGDVITAANNQEVKTVSELKKIFDSAKKAGRNYVLIKISRSGGEAFIPLPVKEKDKKN